MVTAVQLEHRGRFNLGTEEADRWRPFTSTQRVVTRWPGFVWDGRVAAMPGVAVQVHDACVAGEGLLRPALLGLFTLMDLRGTSAEAGGAARQPPCALSSRRRRLACPQGCVSPLAG